MNLTNFSGFCEIAFNEILPYKKNSTNHPTVLKFQDNNNAVGPDSKRQF